MSAGVIQKRLGKLAHSLTEVQRVLATDPPDLEAARGHVNGMLTKAIPALTEIQQRLGKLAHSVTEVQRALATEPPDLEAARGHVNSMLTEAIPALTAKRGVWRSKGGKFLFCLVVLLVPLSLAYIVWGYAPLDRIALAFPLVGPKDAKHPVNILDIVIYGAWTLLPPLWFFIEYVWIFPVHEKLVQLSLEDMKYTQELAAKCWAGLLVFFSIVLYLKYNVQLVPGH